LLVSNQAKDEPFFVREENMEVKPLISVIVPVYNEETVINAFHKRILAIMNTLPDVNWETLFINDGSYDNSQKIIDSICSEDARFGNVSLSRNFGKEIAMTAGLDHASGDAVVIIDVDLQDPPELIADFVREWQHGYDVVYGKRTHRDGETWLKKATAAGFYRIIHKMSRIDIPTDAGDFRLMSRRAVEALLKLREQHRFMKGLFAWIGFPSLAVEYRRNPRAAGDTKFSYWKLWNLALEGITSFSIAPLKIATYLGLLTAFISFSYGAWIVAKTLIWGDPVRGYPTIMVTMLLLGSIQLFFIGVIGEYLGRIFGETKRRPLYFIQGYKPSKRETPFETVPSPGGEV
jgi:polyisoprenyl-phosphate glycosyltransferase